MTHRQARELSTSRDKLRLLKERGSASPAHAGEWAPGSVRKQHPHGSSPTQARLQVPFTKSHSISPIQAENALLCCGQRDCQWRERYQGTYARNGNSAAEGAQARAGISRARPGATRRGSGRNRLGCH